MTDTPPDWVLIEAAKRSGWCVLNCAAQLHPTYKTNSSYRALCDMIQKYEQPPVDRKLLCAREAMALKREAWGLNEIAGYIRQGIYDDDNIKDCIRAIELWEKGFGRD